MIIVYEVQLELTDGSAEVLYRKHHCYDLDKSYKAGFPRGRTFRKDTHHKVTKLLSNHKHMKFKSWTLFEDQIPGLHEALRDAAIKEITILQTQLTQMYDQSKTISFETPKKECTWL